MNYEFIIGTNHTFVVKIKLKTTSVPTCKSY